MNNVQNKKRANKSSLPFFFKEEFKVSSIIIFTSIILLITTFTFDIVPPILNRGIQPATFPKALLVLIISLTVMIYYLSIKKPWKKEKKLPKEFYLTLLSFILFVFISKTLDFFLAISSFLPSLIYPPLARAGSNSLYAKSSEVSIISSKDFS